MDPNNPNDPNNQNNPNNPTMDGLMKNLAESYFNDFVNKVQYGWLGSTFSSFLPVPNQPTVTLWIAGLSYRLVFGEIKYVRPDRVGSTTKFLIKYLKTSKWPPMTRQGTVPFTEEVDFYEKVLPAFAPVRMTSQMFLKFCTSDAIELPHDERKLIMYEWPESAAVFEYCWPILDVEHCRMMLRRIGLFHARSLLMKASLPKVFEEWNDDNPPLQRFDVDRIRSTLLFCLDQLSQLSLIPRYDGENAERFSQGVIRFEQMIGRFDELLMIPFLAPVEEHPRPSAHESCWVMCHRNYGKESVLFVDGKEDMKIFNCQSMGLASLGVDVVIPLFVEPLGRLTPNNVANMLRTYYTALTEVVPEDERPAGLTEEFVKEEIKKSVPFALYTLASRIVYANTESQFQKSIFTPDVWTEYRVEDLCKYSINSQFS